jgi:hypothetical protein
MRKIFFCLAFMGLFAATTAKAAMEFPVDAGGRIPPSGQLGTSTFTFTVEGARPVITDVDIRLAIKHHWDADLDVLLTSPAGTDVWLFDDLGWRLNNFQDTWLDDEGLFNISQGLPPYPGPGYFGGTRYTLENDLLSTFDGENPNGVWTLTVHDDNWHLLARDTGWLYAPDETAPWGPTFGTKLIIECADEVGAPIPEPVTLLGCLLGAGALRRYLNRR